MRKLTALNKLYIHPPTNEHIERDFKRNLDEAWSAVSDLYDFLVALHQDGLLISYTMTEERALKSLAETRDGLDRELCGGEFELDLPEDAPTAESATVGV